MCSIGSSPGAFRVRFGSKPQPHCSSPWYPCAILASTSAVKVVAIRRCSATVTHSTELASVLAPCLHPKTTLLERKTPVLLHGPAGAGKRLVTRQAAELLGTHVVEYSCHELVGVADGNSCSHFDYILIYSEAFQHLGDGNPSVEPVSRVTFTLRDDVRNYLQTLTEDVTEDGDFQAAPSP